MAEATMSAVDGNNEPRARNVSYDNGVDFDILAEQDGDFARIWEWQKRKPSFRDPSFVQQLTKSLLRRDFALTIALPEDRLCPTVSDCGLTTWGVKMNMASTRIWRMILTEDVTTQLGPQQWLQNLIDTTGPRLSDQDTVDRHVTGLDIGTGASCIYPLLAVRSRPTWYMYATDIDPKSLTFARRNIEDNRLASRIKLIPKTRSDTLLPLDLLQEGALFLDFVMCNPPFYGSVDEMQAALSGLGKADVPTAICTGAQVEMVTNGGDAGFVARLVEESQILGPNRVQWFTSMLGKLSSLEEIVSKLKAKGVTNYAVGVIMQGGRTRRWTIAWSWNQLRTVNSVARGNVAKSLLPFPTEVSFPLPTSTNIEDTSTAIRNFISKLDILWIWRADLDMGLGFSNGNVWSRAARRRNKSTTPKVDHSTEAEQPKFGFMITLKEEGVHVRWVRGLEIVVWESCCGMLKRLVDQASPDCTVPEHPTTTSRPALR